MIKNTTYLGGMFLLSMYAAPSGRICEKIGLCELTFGAACDKKSVVCADSVREKIGPSLRLFLGVPYDKKSVRVRWA